ncbi:uncharacterized protein LOC129336978 [Eublepharis macularius]|uniref:Uncharacterized protein LOC129336978 n=1 Tax=Eublepharis macularius TaxID=481883 RepID=A0AA97K070_EUBMA|nr:uncharacterized protein LOC129336978 [Eublepharis macularius]
MAFETVPAEFSSGPEPSPRRRIRTSPALRSPRLEPSPSPRRSRPSPARPSPPAAGRERRRSGDSVRSARSTASRHRQASYLPSPYHCQWEGAPAGFSVSEPRPSTSRSTWAPPPHQVPESQLGSDEEDVESFGGYQSESWSEPSPAEELVPSADSPFEDLRIYADQMARMAKALEMDISSAVPQTKDKLLKRIYGDNPAYVGFPMLEGLEEIVEKVWQVPCDQPPTSKRIEQLYKIKQGTWPALVKHPPPSSLVTEEFNPRRSGHSSVPADKEGRKLDAMGRRQYIVSSLGLRIANYQTIMAGYQLYLWEKLASYTRDLPPEQKAVVSLLQTEAVRLSKQQMNAGSHAADTAARGMASAVVLRRHSWLRSTALSQEVRSRVESMPFEGDSLFSKATDETLKKKKEDRQTARSLGLAPADKPSSRSRYAPRSGPYHYQGRYHQQRPGYQQYPAYQQRPYPPAQQQRRRRPFKPRPAQQPAQQKDQQGTGRQY